MPEENKTKLRGQIVYTVVTSTGPEQRTLIMVDQDGRVGGVDGEVDLTGFAARYHDGKQVDNGAATAMSSLVDEQLPALAGLSRKITKVAQLDDKTQVFQVDMGQLTPAQEQAFFGPGAQLGDSLREKAIIRQSLKDTAIDALDTEGQVLYGTRLREQIEAGEVSRDDLMSAAGQAKEDYAHQVELMKHLHTSHGNQYRLFTKGTDDSLVPDATAVPAPPLQHDRLVDGMNWLRARGAEIDRSLQVIGVDQPTFQTLQSDVYSLDAIGSMEALRNLAGYSYSTIASTVADRQIQRNNELNEAFDPSRRNQKAYETVLDAHGNKDPNTLSPQEKRQIACEYLAEKRVVEYEKQCQVRAQRGDLETFLRDNQLPPPEEFRDLAQRLELGKDVFLRDQNAHLPPEQDPSRSQETYDQQKKNVEKWIQEELLRQTQLVARERMEVSEQGVFRVKGQAEPLLNALLKRKYKSTTPKAFDIASRLSSGDEDDSLDIEAIVKAALILYGQLVSGMSGGSLLKIGPYRLTENSTASDFVCYRVVTDPEFARSIVEGAESCIVTNPDGTKVLDLSHLSKEMQDKLREIPRDKDSTATQLLVGMAGYAQATYGIKTKFPEEFKELQGEADKYEKRLRVSRAKLEKDTNFKPVGQAARGTAEELSGSRLVEAGEGRMVGPSEGGRLEIRDPENNAVGLVAGSQPAQPPLVVPPVGGPRR